MKRTIRSGLQHKARLSWIGMIAITVAIGCSSGAKKADYSPDANPTEEISKLDQEVENAIAAQHDVLAPKEIKNAQEHLGDAKERSKDQGSLRKIWDDIGYARANLDRARELAERRKERVAPVLAARQKAIDAGARHTSRMQREIREHDDSFRANASELDRKSFDEEKWARTQHNYEVLELASIQEVQVGAARNKIKQARQDGARTAAPQTLKEAEARLAEADRAIAERPYDVEAFGPAVRNANEAADILAAVTGISNRAEGETNEQVAREILARERALHNVNAELTGLEQEGAAKDANLRRMASSQQMLLSEKELNDALEAAQSKFDRGEAEVYRSGDKLLIRLKKMNFASGQSDLPAASMPLLAKVRSTIQDLNAGAVTIEGHTDATGSPQINKKISQDRADAVAKYLESDVADAQVEAVGVGYEKPITSNKTPRGRAQNRRVDILIAPRARM